LTLKPAVAPLSKTRQSGWPNIARPCARVRALQDVLIPEVEKSLADVETGLDELERDEFTFLLRAADAARTS